MTTFERWKFYFERGWATKEQLQRVVQLGALTAEQYEQITGEPYPN